MNAEYERLAAERIPMEPCPLCGRVLVVCGDDCCTACDRRAIQFEEAQLDPREDPTGTTVPRR